MVGPIDGETGRGKSCVGTADLVGAGTQAFKPHLVKAFKLSNDRHFEDKLVDVVGLYLNPPDQAVVLCMDENAGPGPGPDPAVLTDDKRPGGYDDP